jgi:hypothetical protein
MLCSAERVTAWHFEDDECWVADCLVCATPMIVWRPHGLPDAELELRAGLRLALQRPANDDEIADGLELLLRLTKARAQSHGDALRYWCLTVLNLNEFVYLD